MKARYFIFLFLLLGCKEKEKPHQDLIVLHQPEEHDVVSSPLQLRGVARGLWFFEASAPVKVVDAEGRMLGEGYITAEEPWMTENFIPFSGSISFSKSGTEFGYLILEKANPSGLAKNQMSVSVPVEF